MATGEDREEAPEREYESVWERLAAEPLLERTEAISLDRSFLKRLFGGFYEHLGSLILINLAVTAQVAVGVGVGFLAATLMPVPWLGILVLTVLVILFAGPAFAGMFNYTRCMCDDDERTSLGNYKLGMVTYARKSWILLTGQVLIAVVLAINFRFYAATHSTLSLPVMLVLLLLTLIWAMSGAYAWPLLVRGLEWKMLLRNAVFLALAAPFSTIAMLLLLTAASALLALTTVGGLAFLFCIWGVTQNVCMGRLIRLFRARQAALTATDAMAAQP
jgi:hypothetical protein